jgi:uncharacterized protein YndB with AHSA1/START domain
MTDRLTAIRTIGAPPARIFAVLADPAQHRFTEPTEWVRDSQDGGTIERVGQHFAMDMYMERIGGGYVIENEVTTFEPDRSIGWLPGSRRSGEWSAGGWRWRYDLAPTDGGTVVTLTYDWADVPQQTRAQLPPLPPFPPEYLDDSLAALDRHVTAD